MQAEMTASRRALSRASGCLAALMLVVGAHIETVRSEEGRNYQVTMTWVSGDNRYATIDGEFYTVGDELPGGEQLVAIEPGVIRVSKGGMSNNIDIVDSPPSAAASRDDDRPSLSSYLDHVIAELDDVLKSSALDARDQAALENLGLLRDRLETARNRLSSGEMTDQEREQLGAELNEKWLTGEQQLDVIRKRVLRSEGGLDLEELRATQKFLEETMLSALSKSLTALQDPDSQTSGAESSSSDLMQALRELLTSYPNYHALADRLERYQAEQQQ